jgi:hypothetical protein
MIRNSLSVIVIVPIACETRAAEENSNNKTWKQIARIYLWGPTGEGDSVEMVAFSIEAVKGRGRRSDA